MSNLATTDNSAELYSQYSDVSIICWIWVFYVIGKNCEFKNAILCTFVRDYSWKGFVRLLYVYLYSILAFK